LIPVFTGLILTVSYIEYTAKRIFVLRISVVTNLMGYVVK